MGSGFHGGFGLTLGALIRNRIGVAVEETVKDLQMALNPVVYAHAVVQKYGIHLKASGKAVQIVFNSNLAPGVYGRTRKNNPYVIEIGPAALVSEVELANTIAHELNHARDFIRGGNAPEKKAYASGDVSVDLI